MTTHFIVICASTWHGCPHLLSPQEEKVYVQHRIRDDGAELWQMLEQGAHFYICGGTTMGRDVVGALQDAPHRAAPAGVDTGKA